MKPDSKSSSSENKSISIGGDVVDSVVISGDNNTVNKTIIQKFFNIFKSDSETLEQRNRRILLGHVENAWIKGVLDASLHGAALLDLGIKQDPEAVTKYPWAIKKESTDETLPTGTSMLEIFDSIGMGRSLLILGAPGSGKTTMLLELARQLIARAREDITYPIPMVFNLASWTEKLSLADWLAQELNNLYSVPRKTAPDWVKGDNLLLLLDGLDEVRQESRAKCVEAINAFRKEHGMTSLAVCSRSQDYADLNAKLSFEGAIEIQPLTQEQINEFFNRYGKEVAGIKQALEKDSALSEMAETPLFLSIMLMAYRNKQDVEILVSQDEKAYRKHLFDTYIERMFERPRSKNVAFQKPDILRWLSWLASKMTEHNIISYLVEDMQMVWLNKKSQWVYRFILGLIGGAVSGLIFGFGFWRGMRLFFDPNTGMILGLICGLGIWIIFGLVFGLASKPLEIEMFEILRWQWQWNKEAIVGLIYSLIVGIIISLIFGERLGMINTFADKVRLGLIGGGIGGIFSGFSGGLKVKPISQTTYPGQRLSLTVRNFFFISLVFGLIIGLGNGLLYGFGVWDNITRFGGGILIGFLIFGGLDIFKHYFLRLLVIFTNLLPWRLVPFLDHCVDLIFLRRVGGGYIFVHRLLMEHFAEMYVETPTSKGNQK